MRARTQHRRWRPDWTRAMTGLCLTVGCVLMATPEEAVTSLAQDSVGTAERANYMVIGYGE